MTRMSFRVRFTLTDDRSRNLTKAQQAEFAAAFTSALQHRLMGEGFAPDDVEIDAWDVARAPATTKRKARA